MSASALIAVKTVLVADDTAFVRDRFRVAIEDAGHRAVTARTGVQVQAAIAESAAGTGTPIDLLIVDLRLPDGRGVELLRTIRRIDPARPPIVVFSGTIANADEVGHLTSLGVVGYINEYSAPQHIVPSLGPHLFPDHYNRRNSPRVAASIAVAYRVANQITAALTINISKGGMAIRTSGPLEVNAPLKVRFRLPSGKKEIDADARVAWSDRRVGMGLQFTRIDPADEEAIAAFADAHFFSNRKA